MAPPVRALLCCAVLLACVGPISLARAQADVLLLESEKLRPGLCVALRIQLTGVASVTCRPDRAGLLPERLARAATALRDEHGRIGVLLERDPDPGLVRMYLVGARPDQAVIAIERIEDRLAPDIDRSLALKVRDAFEVMRSVPVARADRVSAEPAAAPLAAVLAPVTPVDETGGEQLTSPVRSATEPPPESRKNGARTSALFELGGALVRSADTRALGLLAVGVGQAWASYQGELVAGARLASSLTVQSEAGRIDEREWGLSLAARALTRTGRLRVGALVALGFERAHARGRTRSGAQGELDVSLVHFGVGVDVRVHMFEHVQLRLAPTVEIHPIDQRFAVDQQVLLALGRSRVLVPLTLVVELPFANSRGSHAQ
jgi:hypothetical protein